MNKPPKLDKIDLNILSILQEEGRISNVNLAAKVNLSPTPCLERVRRLEESGYIEQYFARVSAPKMGLNLLAYIEVNLSNTTAAALDAFADTVKHIPEIQECHMISGGCDYILKIRVADMTAFRDFLGERFSLLPHVDKTRTYMVMEEVKTTHALKIS